jgi:DMSO/TMAO reductase YedYZ molybdopterin-dependent catalytic subunit
MKKKFLQACLLPTLLVLLIIVTLTVRVSASVELNLQVADVAGNSVEYSYDQLLAMPQTTVYADLYCYGNLVTSGNWTGVCLSYLLQQAGVDPTVSSVGFTAVDGYHVAIPLAFAMRQDVIIAYEKNGSPLSEGLRLVVPGQNGNIWIAAITGIAMSNTDVSLNQPVIIPPLPRSLMSQLTNSASQSSTQQQEPLPSQPTSTPENETRNEPVTPPANVTQPEQKTSVPQGSSSEGFSFPIVLEYGIVLSSAVALVTVSHVIYRRRLLHKNASIPKG